MGDNNNNGNEKLFTQEEVNNILRARLAKAKDNAAKDADKDLESRLKDVEAREHRLMILETLQKKGYDSQLADIIACTDEKDLDSKLQILDTIINKQQPEGSAGAGGGIGFHPVGVAPNEPKGATLDSQIRQAMGLSKEG